MIPHTITAYFQAWNEGRPHTLADLFAPEGSLLTPSSPHPIEPASLTAWAESRLHAIPDLRVQTSSIVGSSDHWTAEWTLSGTNQNPLFPGVPATQATFSLSGVTLFQLAAQGFLRVREIYDQKTLAENLGLMALIQPITVEKAHFGYSMRVSSGNRAIPGTIALTWIRGRDDSERDRIRQHSRQIVKDFLEEPGFIGIVTGFTGERGFTVTAWENEDALRRALSKQHASAMRDFRTSDISPGVWTSVWKPSRINRIWTRCPSCHHPNDVSSDPSSCEQCGASLPPRPSFW